MRRHRRSITAVIKASLGAKPVTWTVIAKGETNAVFRVSLSDGTDVIARQHFSKSGKWFDEESKVLRALRGSVPVPELLATHDEVVEDGVFSLSLQTLIAGAPYSEIYETLTADEHKQILNEAGQLIRRLNRSTPDASTKRVGMGRSRAQYMRMARRIKTSTWPMSKRDRVVLNAALETIKSFLPLSPACDLVHGEVHPKHVMVDAGHVSGLVDLEFAGKGDAAMDQACWNYWRFDSNGKPTYGALRLGTGPEFAQRVAVYELMIGVASLDHYTAHKDWAGARVGLQRLESALLRHSEKHFDGRGLGALTDEAGLNR